MISASSITRRTPQQEVQQQKLQQHRNIAAVNLHCFQPARPSFSQLGCSVHKCHVCHHHQTMQHFTHSCTCLQVHPLLKSTLGPSCAPWPSRSIHVMVGIRVRQMHHEMLRARAPLTLQNIKIIGHVFNLHHSAWHRASHVDTSRTQT